MKRMSQLRGLAAFCAAVFFLAGCEAEHITAHTVPQEVTETAEATQQATEEKALAFAAQENREDELVFSVSMEDFIDSYNGYFRKDHGRDYLAQPAAWQSYTRDTGIHSGYETVCYTFSEDEKIYSLPTITVYIPASGGGIQQITVNYDEHSYTEPTYELYKQLCFYTLKTFFPELPDQQIDDLSTQVNRLGNENVRSSEEWYDSGCVPCALFYKDSVGVYPYFAIGDWVHLCVIPVTSEAIAAFEQKGVVIYEIE